MKCKNKEQGSKFFKNFNIYKNLSAGIEFH